MRVYGVEHGVSLGIAGVDIAHGTLLPSATILEDIRELPADSKVGIEATPEVLTGEKVGLLQFNPEANRYWNHIADVCGEKGLEIVYLDSNDLYEKHIKFETVSREIAKAANYYADTHETRGANELAYGFHVLAEYAFEVEREESIFRKLEETKPDLAIIGKSHGDYMALHPGLVAVDIERYKRTAVDDPRSIGLDAFLSESAEYMAAEQYVLEDSAPDEHFDLAREAIERKHRSVTKGRITEGDAPALMGTWTPHRYHEGLFEVFPESLDGEHSEGAIEDVLGSATYKGSFGDSETAFVKRYFRDLQGEAFGSVTYAGGRTGQEIVSGEYGLGSPDNLTAYGGFILTPNPTFFKPVDFDAVDADDLLQTLKR